eukprot:TRINITY_DN62390_c0_g1_i1.p1 TRINITY_DN62390_c0_g1~~TRINITY_DN62390_c0_g1_i1.p1  ORF type:complete len:276 (+),score=35.28 TRINITY_DN62390_c0_g1_i1:190-1017(+)
MGQSLNSCQCPDADHGGHIFQSEMSAEWGFNSSHDPPVIGWTSWEHHCLPEVVSPAMQTTDSQIDSPMPTPIDTDDGDSKSTHCDTESCSFDGHFNFGNSTTSRFAKSVFGQDRGSDKLGGIFFPGDAGETLDRVSHEAADTADGDTEVNDEQERCAMELKDQVGENENGADKEAEIGREYHIGKRKDEQKGTGEMATPFVYCGDFHDGTLSSSLDRCVGSAHVRKNMMPRDDTLDIALELLELRQKVAELRVESFDQEQIWYEHKQRAFREQTV